MQKQSRKLSSCSLNDKNTRKSPESHGSRPRLASIGPRCELIFLILRSPYAQPRKSQEIHNENAMKVREQQLSEWVDGGPPFDAIITPDEIHLSGHIEQLNVSVIKNGA